MGYRSDVSLVMTRQTFGKMLRSIPSSARELISLADKFQSCEDSILLFWGGIKWYTESTPVNQVHHFLNHLVNADDDDCFHFIRIGDDRTDIEEWGNYYDNPWNISVIRTIGMDDRGTDAELNAFL